MLSAEEVKNIDINGLIKSLFESRWCGESTLSSLNNMKAQLEKTLDDQVCGYWSGSTAYNIAVDGGFLIDSKSGSDKKLTNLGIKFLLDMKSK